MTDKYGNKIKQSTPTALLSSHTGQKKYINPQTSTSKRSYIYGRRKARNKTEMLCVFITGCHLEKNVFSTRSRECRESPKWAKWMIEWDFLFFFFLKLDNTVTLLQWILDLCNRSRNSTKINISRFILVGFTVFPHKRILLEHTVRYSIATNLFWHGKRQALPRQQEACNLTRREETTGDTHRQRTQATAWCCSSQ